MPMITDAENGASVREKLNKILGLRVNHQVGDYTIVANDHAALVAVNSAVPATVTVPGGLPSDFICKIAQLGVGEVTVLGSTAVVNSLEAINVLPGQYSMAELLCTTTNEFLLVIQGVGAAAEPPPPVTDTDTTSAGVFDSAGRLVRTLWSSEINPPFLDDPAAAWDGTLDDGSVAPTGEYTIKLLYHDCTYTWEGVIGNTSPNHNTMRYWNEASPINDMEIGSDGRMWYCSQYHERLPVVGYSNVSDIHNMDYAVTINFRDSWGNTVCVTTDDDFTYYALFSGTVTFVWAVDNATGTYVQWTSGGTTFGGKTNWGAAFEDSATSWINSIAVQKAGNFLYAARSDGDKLLTINKTTGAVLQTNVTFTTPFLVEVNPFNDDLWLCHKVGGAYRITKCAVDGSGNITTTGVNTSVTITTPRSMSISPDGTTLLLIEANTHQIKAFNTSDGSIKSAFGTSGAFGLANGYAADPDVTNLKWLFKNISGFGGGSGWVAYAPDGSFWIGDAGNCRHLHFSSGNSPTYIEKVEFLPAFYGCAVCKNDPTRVFVGYLEYAIDYTKSLSPTNGSWTLVRNWGYTADISVPSDAYVKLRDVGTYANGRTYAIIHTSDVPDPRKWVELTSTGLRDTGTYVSNGYYHDAAMNAYFTFWRGFDTYSEIYINEHIGFDASHNPQYALDIHDPMALHFTTGIIPTGFPAMGSYDVNIPWNHVEATENGIIPIVDANGMRGWTGSVWTPETYHFGGISAVNGEPMFKAQPIHGNNQGGSNNRFLLYPEVPYWPVGHGVNENAGGVFVYEPGEPHIFFCHIGEGGWGNNQLNVWHHYHDSGLLMKRFGVPAPYFASASLTNPDAFGDNIPNSFYSFKALPGMAGNTRWGGHALVGGRMYLYQCDEWYHSGLHRWKINGLDDVHIVVADMISWDSSDYEAPAADPSDLLEGLPYDNGNVPNNTAGWVRDPTSNVTTGDVFTGPWVKLYTNVIKVSPRVSPDLTLECTMDNSTPVSVFKPIPRVSSGDWTLEGKIFLQTGLDGTGTPADHYWMALEILDNTNKVIFTMHNFVNTAGSGCKVNGTDFATDSSPTTDAPQANKWRNKVEQEVPFSIAANILGANMSVTYLGVTASRTVSEVGAALGSPAKVRLVLQPRGIAGFIFAGASITELRYTEV